MMLGISSSQRSSRSLLSRSSQDGSEGSPDPNDFHENPAELQETVSPSQKKTESFS